ncbi:hypothetical protein PENSOL_c044G01953 [Penicillium solitum]|uniref:Uncharacterized protein n=1 Tax=Penicillium solitum TaxID=60172 RepID=A0A1V6QT88_9EURO|nr:uncharacterized protein PENSOL_c044G01953 [Penicillium solitum]OQD92146.1 hypothetical protein PENSOL_c044G01953 [Penicillium solitum]
MGSESQDHQGPHCGSGGLSTAPVEHQIIVPILHPSILLLTKLLPWKEDQAIQVARHMRARTDLTDIRTILQWLVDKKARIDFSGLPGIPKGKLMRLLGRLYRAEQRARPYLSLTLSADEMCDALTADETK